MVARPSLLPVLVAAGMVGAGGADAAPAGESPKVTEIVALDGRPVLPAPGVKVTELLFVARWCPPCGDELETARHRAASLRRSGYRMVPVGLAARESADEFAAWARDHGASGPLVYDDGGRLEAAFEVEALPYWVILDGAGRVLYRGPSPPDAKRVSEWLGR